MNSKNVLVAEIKASDLLKKQTQKKKHNKPSPNAANTVEAEKINNEPKCKMRRETQV